MKKNILFLIVILVSLNIRSVKAYNLYTNLKNNSILDNRPSTFVIGEDGIDFKETSSDTNGKGLYMMSSTVNDNFPIVYFRGDISNNNVIYRGYCWQIIRTTSTGGIKLMYAGIPNNNTCNNTGESLTIGKSQYNDTNTAPKYGWTYYDGEEEKDSMAKSYLDGWYQNNFTEYTRELEDTDWCNDRREENGVFYSRTRLETGNPTLNCDNNDKYTVSSSKGNGKLTYPVGIINADELTYAGEVLKKTQINTFVNIGYSYWAMTPYVTIKNMYPNSKGMLNMYTFTYSAGIRPMISLRNTATFNKGNGEKNNPYTVEVEKQYKVETDEYSTIDHDEYESGKKITVKVKDRIGYKFLNLKVLDSNGNNLEVEIKENNNKYEFIMPSKDIKIETNYRILKDSFILRSNQIEVEIPNKIIEEDQEATFIINKPYGYKIKKIELLDNNENILELSYSQNKNIIKFTMPKEDVNIKVLFEELPKYTVTGDNINTNKDDYYEDDIVYFKVDKYFNKKVLDINFYNSNKEKLDISLSYDNGIYMFKMINENILIKVNYIESIEDNPKTNTR